jgi:DtxR family Mn-dependent transcriptional regulator
MVAVPSRPSEKSRRSAEFPSAASLGAAIEDYLKAIYQLSLASERVAPSTVATKLGISQAAVTKMIKRLRTRRLVRYGRPQGVVLTDSGRRVALEMIRHHRLLEAYLYKALGYSWDEVDREAEILEHAISEEFEDRIDQLLGHPTHDPHGSPIPTKDGRVEDVDFPALGDLAVGQRGTIRRVDGRDPDKLRYLGELGLYPDTPIQLLEREPFGGPLQLLVKGKKRAIGPELARHVFVAVQEGGMLR